MITIIKEILKTMAQVILALTTILLLLATCYGLTRLIDWGFGGRAETTWDVGMRMIVYIIMIGLGVGITRQLCLRCKHKTSIRNKDR